MTAKNGSRQRSIRRRLAGSRAAWLFGFFLRLGAVLRHLGSELSVAMRWLTHSRETTNFNYDLTALNRLHLAWWLAESLGVQVVQVLDLFEELEADETLRAHIRSATRRSDYRRVADSLPPYGRRVAWYALVRLLRPNHVVETGIDKGLGSCILAAALMRNGSGSLTAIDLASDSGWLVQGRYGGVVNLVHQDAATAISQLATPVDLLIHDVHFTATEEREEYQAFASRMGPQPMILNDNAHSHDVLPALAAARGWHFRVFREVPSEHWYKGAEMALAWPRIQGFRPNQNP